MIDLEFSKKKRKPRIGVFPTVGFRYDSFWIFLNTALETTPLLFNVNK